MPDFSMVPPFTVTEVERITRLVEDAVQNPTLSRGRERWHAVAAGVRHAASQRGFSMASGAAYAQEVTEAAAHATYAAYLETLTYREAQEQALREAEQSGRWGRSGRVQASQVAVGEATTAEAKAMEQHIRTSRDSEARARAVRLQEALKRHYQSGQQTAATQMAASVFVPAPEARPAMGDVSPIDDYRRGIAALPWSPAEIRGLSDYFLTASARQSYSLDFAAMLDEWSYFFERLLTETGKAFDEVDRRLGAYVQAADARREFMVKIFSGLISAGLGALGLGPIASAVGEGLVKVCSGIVRSAAEAVVSAVAEGAPAVQEAAVGTIAGGAADKVEARLFDSRLSDLRRREERSSSVHQKMSGMLGEITEAIQTALSDQAETIGLELRSMEDEFLTEQHARELLKVLMREHFLGDMIMNPHSTAEAVYFRRDEVYVKARGYCRSLGAYSMGKVYDRHKMRKQINGTALDQMQTSMEKWVWAKYIMDVAPSEEDVEGGAKAFLSSDALVGSLVGLDVIERRERHFWSANRLTEAEKVAELLSAQSGGSFSVGGRSVGSGARQRIRAWANHVASQSPLDDVVT